MKLVALDLETTGTIPNVHSIIEVAAVVFDTETRETLDEFQTLVSHETIMGDAVALTMNACIIEEIAKQEHLTQPWTNAKWALWNFIEVHFPDMVDNPPVTVGFNSSAFDVAFLKANDLDIFNYRSIELGTLMMSVLGTHHPVASKAAIQALGKYEMAHRALQDCYIHRDLYFLWLDSLESQQG